jgi:Rrf2 family protein
MKLSKKGEYALRAMIVLARPTGKAMTITEVAKQQDLPKKFLEQILLALKAEGLVQSKAGPKGGYELSLQPRDISVARILSAVEEPISMDAPRSRSGVSNEPAGVAAVFDEIRQFVRKKLETISLQELADQAVSQEEMEAIMWYI